MEHGPETLVWSQEFFTTVGPAVIKVGVRQIDARPPTFRLEIHSADSRMPELVLSREQLREIKDCLQLIVSNVRVED